MLRRRRGGLGKAPQFVADVVEVVVNLRAPRLQLPDGSLQCLHLVIAFVADLGQADELEIYHALLYLVDVRVEVGAPVIGDDDGDGVLGGGEALQRGDVTVDSLLALLQGDRGVFEELLQALPALGPPSS
jgi:hypothetical protein